MPEENFLAGIEDDAIFINKDTCIGCKTCMLACPFGALELVEHVVDGEKIVQQGLLQSDNNGKLKPKTKLVVNKCDLCVDRTNGCGPACVEMCPTGALRMVENNKIEESVANKRLNSAMNLLQL